MPTLQQLKNEAAVALSAAQVIVEEKGAGPEYKAAFDDYIAKKSTYEAQSTLDAEQKIFADEKRPAPSELRDPKDADWIPGEDPKSLKGDAQGVMIKGANGRPEFMAYSGPDREGWIKGAPVSAQHPSILRRLPEELLRKAALEREAFELYLRRGLAGFREKQDLYVHLKDLQEGTDSEGGYLVPSDDRSDLVLDPGVPGGVVRGMSSVFQTTRDAGTFPSLTTDMTLAAVAEEAAFPESDPAFGQVTFTIRKVGRAVDLSYELLQDSAVNVPALLSSRFGAARGRYEDEQAIAGDGTTEPQGLRVASVADITDLFTAAPTALEVLKAFYELPAQFRPNSTWFMTSMAFAQILAVGSAAAGIHIIDRIDDGVAPRLLGRPVVFFDGTGWDDAATMGTTEEIGAIGDFRNYYMIDNGNPTVSRSDDVAFRTDQVVFKYRVRFDGRVAIVNAFRILKIV